MTKSKLKDKSLDFAIDIINLSKELKTKKESIISNQIARISFSFRNTKK